MDLSIDVRKQGDVAVIDVHGEVDVFSAPKLREQFVELIENGHRRIVVSLEGVEFLDSTGLGVLVAALKSVRVNDGSLGIVCTQEKILKIFRITGLTKVFQIHDTVRAAVKGAAAG